MKRAAVFALLLSGCGQPSHSASWFEAHPQEAVAVVKRCTIGTQTGPECQVAADAIRRAEDDRLKQFRKGF